MADQVHEPKANWRLLRIANHICVCNLTDGFCNPEGKPECECWTMARLAVQGLRNLADPALKDAWPDLDPIEARAQLYKLCHAILSKRDGLTERIESTAGIG